MSKQNRQKRKQAKLQRRKRRQKRAETPSSPAPKQDLLREMMAELENEAAFSNMKSVINPPGQEKMSEVLGQFIEPYMDAAEDVASMQKLTTIAMVAWNAAILADDRRESFLDSILDAFPKKVRVDAARMIEEMIQRTNRYFADNRRQIVNVQVTDTGDGFHLAVASLMSGQEL
jgi:O6-methylguanine-DNA--protein-cysteine methyltransferase